LSLLLLRPLLLLLALDWSVDRDFVSLIFDSTLDLYERFRSRVVDVDLPVSVLMSLAIAGAAPVVIAIIAAATAKPDFIICPP